MTINLVIFLTLSFLGLLLSLYFFFKKTHDKYANRLIATYTLFFAFEMFVHCLKWHGSLSTINFVHFNLSHAPIWLIYGPIVYLYASRIISNERFKKKNLILFIPSIVLFFLIAPFYFIKGTKKLEIVVNNSIYDYAIFPSYAIWIVIVIMTFFGVYTLYSFKKVKNVGFREYAWLKWFVGSYFGLVFLFALYVFLIRFNIMDAKYDYFIDSGIAFFICMLGYFSFIQPEVFNGSKKVNEILPFIKYKKTGLSKAVAIDLKKKLIKLMEQDKPYLRNDLRLNDLAALLNVSRHHTSQIINENFNLSFFDFINKFRVEHAKELLDNYKKEDLNINQIAYSVGFNNRASFYKAFKKFTNATPTKYVNHLKVS